MVSVPTTCPFCACGCGFFLQGRDGGLIGVAPGESHPVAAGKICARGWNAHEAPLWGKRVLQPMVRRDGNLRAGSWDVALEYVASRMRSLIREGKPVGVLGSARATNEENYLAVRLARAGLQTNHVDFSHHSLCRPLMAGVESVTGSASHAIRLADIETSDTIVLVEGDLATTHPRAAASVLKALERGARLIVIGCARTQMARLASRFMQTAPGSEGSAINGLLAAVLRTEEQEGRQAAMPHAGYDSLRRDLEAASVSDEIRAAAGWIATAERAVFLIGPSGGRADRLRGDAASVATLAAITGHLGRRGCGLLLLLGRSNVRGACDMGAAPDRLPGYECIDDGKARQRLQQLWRKSVPQDRGLDAQKMLESVSGLIVLADDPAAILPMGQRARAALERMEFLVVLDAFVTPAVTAAHATLPIASFAETEGTVTNMEGRVQKVRAATVPPGEAMDGWKVLAELCARFDAGCEWSSAADVLREIAEAAPRYSGTVPQVLDDGWGSSLVEEPEWARLTLQASPTGVLTSPERPYVLARDGAFDWGGDPLVSSSPTLSREYQSERKLFPNGLVEMSGEDADALGVRPGWRVTLNSAQGGAVVPIRLRKDLQRGVLLAPYGFRDWLADVLGEDGVAAVNVERA
jgi:predicted molibdopterin-dependent oxidoreductase YjgC